MAPPKGHVFKPALQRVLDKVMPEPNSGCWLWTGALSAGVYGSVAYEGRMQKAHRVAYRLLVGEIPEGMTLDHLCRTPMCCNPDHLEPVTQSENLRRSPLMDRNSTRTHCIRGHEFSEQNTRIRPSGHRECRACMRMHVRNWRARNASAA